VLPLVNIILPELSVRVSPYVIIAAFLGPNSLKVIVVPSEYIYVGKLDII
jgi:hypothetical protein